MPSNRRGFSIIEVLISALIGASMVGVLFYALNSGEQVNDISSTKVLAQSEARRVIDWVNRDLRQAVVWDLCLNSPSATHIKFRPVLGWDIPANTWKLGDNIEYNYDTNTNTLTRNSVNSVGEAQSWVFRDIIAQPFFTRDSLGNLIALDGSVSTSKKVIILISVKKVSNKGVDSTISLTTETKIRNDE